MHKPLSHHAYFMACVSTILQHVYCKFKFKTSINMNITRFFAMHYRNITYYNNIRSSYEKQRCLCLCRYCKCQSIYSNVLFVHQFPPSFSLFSYIHKCVDFLTTFLKMCGVVHTLSNNNMPTYWRRSILKPVGLIYDSIINGFYNPNKHDNELGGKKIKLR